jgi:hypothetical protein
MLPAATVADGAHYSAGGATVSPFFAGYAALNRPRSKNSTAAALVVTLTT